MRIEGLAEWRYEGLQVAAPNPSNRHSANPSIPWSVLTDEAAHPGHLNMALDQALLDRAERTGEGFLRLYQWQPYCLSLGRHEPARDRYDRDEIERRQLDVVRRPTGGRAVWHARELTYAVAAPIEAFGAMPQAYCAIHRALVTALSTLGAAATLAPPPSHTPALGGGACFASTAGGEVLVAGRKLIGSAQLRQGSAFLQHGSLLLEDDQQLVAQVSRGGGGSGEITLRQVLGMSPDPKRLAQAILAACRSWGGAWREQPLPTPPQDLVARFRDPEWTWRR